MALILKVCKCVLQLVENLAFMPSVHLESICKCVLQFELKFLINQLLSEISVVPACTTRNYRAAVVPVFLGGTTGKRLDAQTFQPIMWSKPTFRSFLSIWAVHVDSPFV